MGPPRTSLWLWGVVAVLACKADGRTTLPRVADDIAEIEARLQSNEDELVSAGIMVAQVDPADTGPSTTQDQPPAPSPVEEEAVYERDDDAGAPALSSSRRTKAKAARPDYRERRLRKRRAEKDDAEQCKRICDLAEATCALADRICDLAAHHPDELRYEQACNRAETQCELASEACTACVAG